MSPITRDTPITIHTERNTFPAMARSMGSSERDEIMSAGVARYMTKSFMAERFIFLFLPKI